VDIKEAFMKVKVPEDLGLAEFYATHVILVFTTKTHKTGGSQSVNMWMS